jgi:phage-related baseplate assembly protein
MSVPTLQQLFTPLTRDQVMAAQLQVATALGLPTTAWMSESVDLEILTINAANVSSFSDTAMAAAAGGLLDYASGDWLTLLAHELYEVDREEATFGTCPFLLTNTSAISVPLNPGDLRVYNTASGKTYTSTTGGTLPPGNVTPTTLLVTIVADETGTESNAVIGEITGFVTPVQGVTGTNTEILVGSDEQSDTSLRALCRESLAKASPNGPSDAYNYFAKISARPDGTSIGVTRTNLDQGDGVITTYVADASGPIDSGDLAYVDSSIQLNAVPTGFTAVTTNATAVTVNIATTVYLSNASTVTVAELEEAIEEKLTEYFSAAPIGGYQVAGGYIFYDAIIGQLFAAAPGQIIQATLQSPADDVALLTNEVAVLGTITVTLGSP